MQDAGCAMPDKTNGGAMWLFILHAHSGSMILPPAPKNSD
jgi:hypothetical protein